MADTAPQVVLSEAFQTATKESKQLKKKPSNDELLDLYALYKIATGADITKADKPGMFDLKGKAKMTAWQKLVDENVTAEDAQERYVKLVEELKDKYDFDPEKEPETVGA